MLHLRCATVVHLAASRITRLAQYEAEPIEHIDTAPLRPQDLWEASQYDEIDARTKFNARGRRGVREWLRQDDLHARL